MTIPRRADIATGDIPVARNKMLAELPHVAEKLPTPSVSTPANERAVRAPKSVHPAFAESIEEDFDSDELSPRKRRRRQTRYVDQAHIDHEWERDEQYYDHHEYGPRPERGGSPQTLTHRQRTSQHRTRSRSPVGAFLSEAHEQIAPFAGLIVTAALVAAAGLLFHMMSGNRSANADLDEFALPGFQVEATETTVPTDESLPLAEVTTAPEPSEVETPEVDSSEVAAPQEATKTSPVTDTRAENSSVPVAESLSQSTAPLGQLSFPVTDTPQALDYSKAVDPELQQLPAVAERPDSPVTEAINR